MKYSQSGVVGRQLVAVGIKSATLMCELVELCARFDESNEWLTNGSPTAAHWIAQKLDVEISTAREWVRIGKRLSELPLLAKAFRSQRLSYSKVRALTRFAKTDNEAELIVLAESVPASRISRTLAKWSLENEDENTIKDRQHRERGVFMSTDVDGSFYATVRLTAIGGAKFAAIVDAKMLQNRSRASADAPATLAQQRADALIKALTDGPARVGTEVIIHVRGDGATLDDGTPIANSIVSEIADESFIRVLIHDAEGRPVNASSKRRHPTKRQKLVVKERDKCCVDCGSEDFLEYDHVPEYDITGRTVTDELQLRCSRCHALRHDRKAS